jgi:hypothetical protein
VCRPRAVSACVIVPRPYHSPSSIALGARCRHAWALQYIDGQRDPDVTWAEIAAYKYDKKSKRWFGKGGSCTSRSRSTALGKEIHATFERWYDRTRGEPDWRGLPGQIANSACHLLPHPSRVDFAQIEQSIGKVPLPPSKHAHAPKTALLVHGVLWGGYRDLLVEPAHAEARRLKLPAGLVLHDYKSTADIARYALTSDELRVDVQASLYVADVCKLFGRSELPARWIYLETKENRRALAVDTLIELSRAHDTIGPCADLARELDSYVTSSEAPKNPLACSDYGPPDRINCPHHKSNGGTCEVKRSFGALIQLGKKTAKKEAITMALTAEQQAKVEARKAAIAAIAAEKAAKEAAASAEPEEEKSEGAEEGAEVEEEAPPKPSAPVKLAAAVAAKKLAPVSQADQLTALAAELKAADKARDAVLAKLRQAVA